MILEPWKIQFKYTSMKRISLYDEVQELKFSLNEIQRVQEPSCRFYNSKALGPILSNINRV